MQQRKSRRVSFLIPLQPVHSSAIQMINTLHIASQLLHIEPLNDKYEIIYHFKVALSAYQKVLGSLRGSLVS